MAAILSFFPKPKAFFRSTVVPTSDDYDEVIVNGQDLRQPVYETKQKDEHIIKCIGQLRVTYKYDDHSLQSVGTGTGTVFKSVTNNGITTSFIITCAHNIRTIIFHCNKCNKYMETRNDNGQMITKCIDKNCNGAGVDLTTQMIKPTQIEFKRRSIHKLCEIEDPEDGTIIYKFGDNRKCYSDCSCVYVDDENYQKHPRPSSGFDFAFLSFVDDDGYYPRYCRDIRLKPGQSALAETNKFYLFGYPGDKAVNVPYPDGPDGVDKLYRYPMYGMESSLNRNFSIKKNSETHMFYLKQREIDTAPGQSGSSIWYKAENDKTVICAIHTGGNRKNKYNVATLLSDELVKTIKEPQEIDTKLKIRRRLANELKAMTEDPPSWICGGPADDDIFVWNAAIAGPADTPYDGGVWFLKIVFPVDYPLKPPKINFVNKIHHPNIHEDGRICNCKGILGDQWTGGVTISKLLLSISSLLRTPDICFLYDLVLPWFMGQQQDYLVKVAQMYKQNRKEFDRIARDWTRRYAM
eukprot:384461_1